MCEEKKEREQNIYNCNKSIKNLRTEMRKETFEQLLIYNKKNSEET